jgi:hypothetical protein
MNDELGNEKRMDLSLTEMSPSKLPILVFVDCHVDDHDLKILNFGVVLCSACMSTESRERAERAQPIRKWVQRRR